MPMPCMPPQLGRQWLLWRCHTVIIDHKPTVATFCHLMIFIGPKCDHSQKSSCWVLFKLLYLSKLSKLIQGFIHGCEMDFSKFMHGFLEIVTWICQTCYMDLFKLLHGLVLCISRSLPNKTKLKFDRDFKACWSFCFELKVLNESIYSMPWVCCAFGNVFKRWPL